jgi:hypothetical protein
MNPSPRLRRGLGEELKDDLFGRIVRYSAPAAAAIHIRRRTVEVRP